jgi:hypothetical protein
LVGENEVWFIHRELIAIQHAYSFWFILHELGSSLHDHTRDQRLPRVGVVGVVRDVDGVELDVPCRWPIRSMFSAGMVAKLAIPAA